MARLSAVVFTLTAFAAVILRATRAMTTLTSWLELTSFVGRAT
jgi:hypothetical protein